MRFHDTARRVFLAPALGLALAVAITACSSGNGTTTSTPPATTPATSAAPGGPASTPANNAATTATIKANWEAFFSASTPTSKRISLLQNGQKFASEIQALSGGIASAASAKVTSVTLTSPTQATVKYQILLGGVPAPIPTQTGVAVYNNGTWQVGDASFCALLVLANNGKAPSVCSSAG
jgi:hypothetical protein